jgi:eukaryotic-like serine/threonine-protein kinase
MNYCHECGSEIAEIDTFCPFCGIALQPSAKPESSADQEDKTIAGNQADLPDVLPPTDSVKSENTADSNISDEISTSVEAAVDSELKDRAEQKNEIATPEQTDQAGAESLPYDSTLVDIPRPQVLSEEEKAEAADESAEVNSQNQIQEPPEVEKEEIEPSEISAELTSDEEDSSNIPLTEADITETVPYVNSQDLGIDKLIAQSTQNQDSAGEKSESETESGQTDSEPEQNIEKPEIPIEETENRDTTFDSVRIMDDAEMESDEVVISEQFNKENSENKLTESQKELEKEDRPQTTPNIGVGDTDGRKSPKLKPLDEGTVLNGRYEIVRKIGGGGMGAVYLATDRNLGGILRAVKEMIQSYIEEEQQDKAISDFKRESMLLTSLDHPSIPTIYDYFYDEKEGRFYLVMKYISGGDLASRLRAAPEGRIDEETVISWAIQISDVLDYLHNRQPPIVYRDLKPANIMIDGNTGRTMLIDFGIARWINKEEKGVTAVGTMGYAPPELFSGKVEASSDIYSLGSTMFHLLTGADPQSNPLLIFDFQKHPRPRQINPQLSDQMEKILMKMVEYNAEKRFKSAAEVRDTLTDHLENLKGGKATYGISKSPSAVSFSEQTVFCGFCGQKIVATDMFCAFCGSKQPIAQQGVHSAEYHLPQTTARLMIIGTNELAAPTFVIEKEDNLVGRRDPLSNIFPEIDLSKFDPQTKISRRHAHIWREGGEFLIEDLGSSNGTLVLRVVGDAVKLNPHQPHPLINGEKIKVGDTTLHFVVG